MRAIRTITLTVGILMLTLSPVASVDAATFSGTVTHVASGANGINTYTVHSGRSNITVITPRVFSVDSNITVDYSGSISSFRVNNVYDAAGSAISLPATGSNNLSIVLAISAVISMLFVNRKIGLQTNLIKK